MERVRLREGKGRRELRRHGQRFGRVAIWLIASVMGLTTMRAQAHLVSTGLGPFYDGMIHLLISPVDMVGLAGWVLLAGMQGAWTGRVAMWALPVAWMMGGLWGLTAGAAEATMSVAGAGALTSGLLVAMDRRLPRWGVVLLVMLTGISLGYCTGSAGRADALSVVSLLGVGLVVFVLVALGAALVLRALNVAPWARVIVRVAGSWVAAIGLLMLGWAIR